jgi:hypothetical protein
MKSTFDLCKDAFNAINEYKRSRTHLEGAKYEGNNERIMLNELKMFKAFDRIELTLRAIQSNERCAFNEDTTKEAQSIRAIK